MHERKILVAKKVLDGWYIQIVKSLTVSSESEVLDNILYEGLKENKELSNDRSIYAD